MGLRDTAYALAQVPTLLALKKALRPRPLEEADCIARQVERNAEQFAGRPALLCEGASLSWAQFNALANRYARCLKARGLAKGDAVGLFMESRLEFLAAIVALNKLGLVAALVNSSLRGRPLIHCLSLIQAKLCIFGGELADALADAKGELRLEEGRAYLFLPDAGHAQAPDWASDLAQESAAAAQGNLPETAALALGDIALYLFTSGTTGLPKAARVSNRRFLAVGRLSQIAGLKCTHRDRLYLCLPLYHGTGLMVGAGAALASGASLFIRRKFSASHFLDEVRAQGASCLIYIGEMCRYLLAAPPQANDRDNPLRTMMGNGLRPDIWMQFKKRFGIRRIVEFYGSSEGNVFFANLLNKEGTIGMTAGEIALAEYDLEAEQLVLDERGRGRRAHRGQPGLLLGKIKPTAAFEGYTDPEATERKILRNLFEDGDAWFNTGDLLRQIEAGFTLGYPHYQFVDRLGDTYRWKSENVSTNEVGEILNGHPQIEFSNVYGVEIPGIGGRAGMAALTLAPGVAALDLEDFSRHVERELPAFARPVFLRVQADIELTGTFKMLKGDLKKQGWDPQQVADPLYVLKPGSILYEPLDEAFAAQLKAGTAGY